MENEVDESAYHRFNAVGESNRLENTTTYSILSKGDTGYHRW